MKLKMLFAAPIVSPPSVNAPTVLGVPVYKLPPDNVSEPPTKPVPVMFAPLLTITPPVPVKLPVTTKFPVDTVTGPLKLLVPDSVRSPPPSFTTDPVPLIDPAYVNASLRLNASAALLMMLPLSDPLVDPAPTCNVPPEIVVCPV